MITYTWSISKLDCAPSENGLTNVVKVIHWSLTGQDESGVSAFISNSYPVSEPNPEAFVDYSTLTEETVVEWLKSNLDVGYLQTTLANEIASKYNPPITSLPFPWIKPEEPVVIEEPILEEMIADGYNPDVSDIMNGGEGAVAGNDGGDGLIQDGTDWETPVDN